MGDSLFILSVLSNFIIYYYFKKKNYYILLLFPLFAFSGRWLYSLTHVENSIYFSYFEIILSILIMKEYKVKDENTRILYLLPLSSLPSLINISGFDNYLTTAFYFVILMTGVGYYGLFKQNMKRIVLDNIIEKIVIVWTILGIFYKITSSIEMDASFFLVRAGSSLWASNHQAMIILLFMPFIKRKWVLVLSIGFICLHFSRGVYMSLALYVILYFLFFSKINAAKLVAYTALPILLGLVFLNIAYPRIYDFGEDIIYSRFIYGGSSILDPMYSGNSTLTISDILQGFQNDDRTNIHEDALKITSTTNYMGIGLGNFLYGLYTIGSPRQYSNAHNLYYTLLSEGGILFLVIFSVFMVSILKKAFIYDRQVFISIVVFLFYGLFSGQIYESTSFRSCIDYFYIIFLLAYLKNTQIKSQNLVL